MSLKPELTLKSALLSTSLVLPVDSKSSSKHLEILCRQMPGQEKPWLKIVLALLEAAHASAGAFEVHICRRYVLKNGELAFGWNLGVEVSSKGKIQEAVDALAAVLTTARPTLTREAEEEPRQQLQPRHLVQQRAPAANTRKAPHTKPSRERMLPLASRPPGESGFVDEAPPGFVPSITTVKNTIDESTGKPVVIREMPLPHVFRDLNRPTPGGRGAKVTGG